MDNIFFNNFINYGNSNWGYISILNGLLDDESIYKVVYNAIMSRPSFVIMADSDPNKKIEILDNMIKFFESREEYEKCNELVKIKNCIK